MYNVIMKTNQLYEFIWMSRPLMQAAEACVEEGLAGTGLTVRMRAILEMLHTHGDMTVPDIATKLSIQRQYVQLMVTEPLASGFTAQRPNPRHIRSLLLTLTEQCRDLIEDVIAKEMNLMNTLSTGFDDAEVTTALKLIQAVTERLKATTGDNT